MVLSKKNKTISRQCIYKNKLHYLQTKAVVECKTRHCSLLLRNCTVLCLMHWRQTKLYSEAIELVCGGSPIGRVLVEKKAQHRGTKEQQQHRPSLNQMLVQYKCKVLGIMNRSYLHLPLSSLQGSSSLWDPPD